ncbi:hypothetical protein JJJ17_07155 [Paracoccus caeni]|uniref:Uncharacterized protein n=1 Tax=Paracoccus caeni TaxID=657651 RepID=A0A934SD39_9RHOB|nr:hypothetical protein [Paracoccus caeni]MBK4215697.1 hypothetical protein [Paracoccus caeni]
MTYPLTMDKLMRTDRPKDWAFECISTANGLIKTAHLALENMNAGRFDHEDARHAVTYSLEAALGLMAVAEEGVQLLQVEAGTGEWPVSESPITRMHKEITRLNKDADAFYRADDTGSGDTAQEAAAALMSRILELPATTAHDALRKLMGATLNGVHEISDGPPEGKVIWDEIKAILGVDE